MTYTEAATPTGTARAAAPDRNGSSLTPGSPSGTVSAVAETQRQPVPRNDAGEADTALAFLTFARERALKKTDGLSDDQLRRVLVESGTSLLGLVQHLTDGERYWFYYHVAGRGDDDYDFSMDVPTNRSSTDVIKDYREAIAESDAILANVDFDAPVAHDRRDHPPCRACRHPS